MRSSSPRARGAALCVAVAAVALSIACNDSTAPGGGGTNHQTATCQSLAGANWNANNVQVQVTSPPCGFTVLNGVNSVVYAGTVTVPTTNLGDNAFANMEVDATNSNGFPISTVATAPGASFTQDPNSTSMMRAQPSASGSPGATPVASGSNQLRDSIALVVSPILVLKTTPDEAIGAYVIPGTVTSVAPTMVVPSEVLATTSATWRLHTDYDTTAYRYKWRIDGADVFDYTGASHPTAFSLAGAHQVSGIAIRADNTADTVTVTAGVAPKAVISGQADITATGTYTWTATPTGCNGSCTYAWSYQTVGTTTWNTLSSTGPSVSRSVGTNTYNFTLRLILTSAGYSSTTTFSVLNEAYTGGGSCGPSAC